MRRKDGWNGHKGESIMTRAEELISKIENCTVEETISGDVDKWQDELAGLPEGDTYFNKKRDEQKKSLDELGRSLQEEMKSYPES